MIFRTSIFNSFSKRFLVLFLVGICVLFGYTKSTFAFYELGSENSSLCVDITKADDFYTLYSVRTTELTVTDSSQFSQTYDGVNFNSIYGGDYDLDTLYSQGYRTMVVEITMDIKEDKDGYQHIYFYDDTSTTSLLRSIKFEHFPGSKNTIYKTYTFYVEIDMASVTDNDFFIRYSASGMFSDNWKNKNVKIQVGWSEETVKAAQAYSLVSVVGGYIATQWPNV